MGRKKVGHDPAATPQTSQCWAVVPYTLVVLYFVQYPEFLNMKILILS